MSSTKFHSENGHVCCCGSLLLRLNWRSLFLYDGLGLKVDFVSPNKIFPVNTISVISIWYMWQQILI